MRSCAPIRTGMTDALAAAMFAVRLRVDDDDSSFDFEFHSPPYDSTVSHGTSHRIIIITIW